MRWTQQTTRHTAVGMVLRYLSRLRFPQLFVVTAALFLLDLLFPDAIPFVDEILLGLVTVLLGSWRKRRRNDAGQQPH
jgi:hypothetical protein